MKNANEPVEYMVMKLKCDDSNVDENTPHRLPAHALQYTTMDELDALHDIQTYNYTTSVIKHPEISTVQLCCRTQFFFS